MLTLPEISNRAALMSGGEVPVEAVVGFANPEPRQESSSMWDGEALSIIHDLRSPLAAVGACAEMLRDGQLGPAQTRRLTETLLRAARRMRELMSDFADVARGHTEISEVCNLRAVIEAACDAACDAACTVGHDGTEVLLDVPPSIEVVLTRARMERVFVNLIVNALEAMPGGGAIRINAREADGSVLIEVEDTGPGIPDDIRRRLFEAFATSGKKEGLGLGLKLSHDTVREHGGELWAESTEGARFVISLPLKTSR